MNVHFYAFGDPDMLAGALETIPDRFDVYVFDGRHADFPADRDRSPEFAELCIEHDAEYYCPLEQDLPYGKGGDLGMRAAGYQKSRFVFENLPNDEWTLKMDTDERLEGFDLDMGEISDTVKVAPRITEADRGEIHVARLFKPQHWTPWIGDCLLPRDIFPLDHPLECLHRVWSESQYRVIRFIDRYETKDVRIRNVGHERDSDYMQRRLEQLETRQRADRAADLASNHPNL